MPKNPWENVSFYDPHADDTPLLPSRSNVPNIGWMSGGGDSPLASGGGFDWSKGIKAGVGLLPALFAGGGPDRVTPVITDIQNQSATQLNTARALSARGAEDLHPVAEYFRSLVSGDPAQVLAATAPQRRRVIDQYDTARRSAGQFTPRGGGQASGQMESRAREAGDLASLSSDTISQAASALAQVGSTETQAGLQGENAAIGHLTSVLAPLLQQQQANQHSIVGTFLGIASLIAGFL